MPRIPFPSRIAFLVFSCGLSLRAATERPDTLLSFLQAEARRNFAELKKQDSLPPYFLAYRVHDSELGYRDDRRWSERPEEYLRRALEGELFERAGVRRVLAGAATTLDVELTAFEEVRDPTPHVRLALTFRLHDDRQVSLERSLLVERPLVADGDKDHAQRVATALGQALAQATADVGAEVVPYLRSQSERKAAERQAAAP